MIQLASSGVDPHRAAGLVDSRTHKLQRLLTCREGSKDVEGHAVVVHANELVYEGGVSTGDLVRCAALSYNTHVALVLNMHVAVLLYKPAACLETRHAIFARKKYITGAL